jgi:hypothetical protein
MPRSATNLYGVASSQLAREGSTTLLNITYVADIQRC